MSDDRAALEQRLLRDPFDVEARERYARLLLDAAEYGPSREQWRVLLKQQPSAGAHLGSALCCLRLGDEQACREHVAQARQCADFDDQDPRLAELDAAGGGARRLQLLAGGKGAPPRGLISYLYSVPTPMPGMKMSHTPTPWCTRITSCSMIGPASRSAVT